MDDEALTRILDAVGSKFIPANLDRDGLRTDIQLAAWWWMQITGEKKQPARLRRLQDIRRAAEDLKRLLEEDAQSGLALSKYPFTGSDPLTVLNQLTNYVNRVLEPPEPPDGMQTRPVPLKGSAFDWAMLVDDGGVFKILSAQGGDQSARRQGRWTVHPICRCRATRTQDFQ